MAAPPDFKTLLEQSRKLAPGQAELPKLERGIGEIDELSRKLASKRSRLDDAAKVKAHYMLAGKGFDSDRLTRSLETIDLTGSFEPLEPLVETDIRGFLTHQHQLMVTTVIEEAKKHTADQFEGGFTEALATDWEAAKLEVLDAFGVRRIDGSAALRAGLPDAPAAPAGWQQAPEAAWGARSGDGDGRLRSTMTEKMCTYVETLWATQTERTSVVETARRFLATAAELDERDMRQPEVVDAWHMVVMMLTAAEEQPEQSKEQPEAAYVRGARQFLELQYRRHMSNQCQLNRTIARISGKPSMLNLVRGWLNVEAASGRVRLEGMEDVFEGYSAWMQIFYCIRCGEIKAAGRIAQAAGLDELEAYIEQFGKRPRELPVRLWREIHTRYRAALRDSSDSFKIAVLNILGHCDPSGCDGSSAVLRAIQDFLWIKLVFVDFVEADEQFSLEQFQELLTSFGAAHFSPGGRNPLAYVQVLLLSAQFRAAVEFLAKVDAYVVEALHLGLVLRSIAAPDGGLDEPLSDLLTRYVRRFAATDALDAFLYLWLLPDADTRDARVVALLTETGEFGPVLGAVGPGGSRSPGAADRLLQDEDAVAGLCGLVATECERSGNFVAAIRLLDLAGRWDDAVELLCAQLAVYLVAASPQRRELLDLARSLRVNFQFHLVAPAMTRQLAVLRSLASFFDRVRAGQWAAGLADIRALDLVPGTMAEMEDRIDAFRALGKAVLRNFPDVLVAVMTCLFRLSQQARGVSPDVGAEGKGRSMLHDSSLSLAGAGGAGGEEGFAESRAATVTSLREQARVLVAFAGMIQYRLPADVSAKLVRMELWMG